MAEERTTANDVPDNNGLEMNAPTPAPTDPGGAHAKGYSADPRPEEVVQDNDPVPLAKGPDKHPAFRVPERDNNIQPTGRGEPDKGTPNDPLLG